MERKDWGNGIPSYSETDLMTEEELLRFAMDIVAKYELNGNGYELVDWSCRPNVFPNIVLKKDEKLIFVVVKVAVAPNHATLSNFWKNSYAQKAKKDYCASCFFASVNIGACDAERFDAGLALRGDAFYANYNGLEELNGDIPITQEEIDKGLAEAKNMN